MNSIVLASKSPRRQELLSLITSDFEVIVSDEDEVVPKGISATEVPSYLAKLKANAVYKRAEGRTVIGADTVVILDDTVMGKPKNAENAKEMLRLLSGKTHIVITGVCVIKDGVSHTFSVTTTVEFYPLSEQEIESYVATGEPLDKAGAYGIQHYGTLLVKSISGDFYNVVGLPVSQLCRELKSLNAL